MRKVTSSSEQFGPVFYMLVSKIQSFVFKIRKMVKKIEMDVDILFGSKLKKKISTYIAKIELFFNFETKSCLSTSVFIFTTISQILKRKFYVL